MIKLLLGGSPCTHWSIAQTKNRETKAEGIGWELFLNYVIAKEKFQPDYFLYENNWSASLEIKEQIQAELGCKLMRINSSLVSAQSRDRFYVFNWDVEQPKDRHIYLSDILDRKRNDWRPVGKWVFSPFFKSADVNSERRKIDVLKTQSSSKSYTITTKKGHPQNYILNEERTMYTNLTIEEYEKLQTLPVGYTLAVPKAERYKTIGNGWTAEVIIHILNGALKDVPRDEKIVVLSMYDGIATGRYCLDKMGFKNVEYHAYEIDKYAVAVAMSNYPDIIQHGDAYQVRSEDWKI